MRHRQKYETPSGRGKGFQGKSQHRQPDIAILATACCCGGPGGRPGMNPVCMNCFRLHKAVTAAIARQAGCYFTECGDADRAKLSGAL